MSGSPPLGPVVLEGRHVRLEPLTPDHKSGLLRAGQFDDIWTYLPQRLDTEDALDARLQATLAQQALGLEFPFAVVERATGQVVGSTSYLDVSEANRSIEIGWTWYTPAVWGTT